MLFYIKIAAFAIFTCVILWVSRSSIRKVRSHGFYRCFAWESILVLALINLDYWFYEPFSIHQIISWLLLFICTYFVIHGALLLRKVGRPDDRRVDPSLIGIEKTTKLVTEGAYRYIRHPLYSSLLFLAWGAYFKRPTWAGTILALIATFFLMMTARMEEFENLKYFGDAYQAYMKRTKMFIPYLF
jgi:protein-S-isoprenylcysteine O-methyltransferase Ste14